MKERKKPLTLLGKKVRDLRLSNGMTQAALAEELGTSDKFISLLERNETSVSVSNLITLADIFNVSLDLLVDREKDSNNPEILDKYDNLNKANKEIVIHLMDDMLDHQS